MRYHCATRRAARSCSRRHVRIPTLHLHSLAPFTPFTPYTFTLGASHEPQPQRLSHSATSACACMRSRIRRRSRSRSRCSSLREPSVSFDELAVLGELEEVALPDVLDGRLVHLEVGANEDERCEVRGVDVRVGESTWKLACARACACACACRSTWAWLAHRRERRSAPRCPRGAGGSRSA